MNKIEKKNVLPEFDSELAKLKQEVLKKAPQLAKQEKKPETVPNIKKISELDIKNDLTQKENADKNLEAKLDESENKLENLATNESPEAGVEKTPHQRTKIIHAGGGGTIKDFNLPEDATANVTNNRIVAANAPLKEMLAATGPAGRVFKKLFGFSEADKIPENLA